MESGYFTWRITDAAGVLQHRAVVQGTNAKDCKKPTGSNEGKFVGITQEAQDTQNRNVVLKESGRSFAVAAGIIAVGDYVRIADATGKVESAQTDAIAAPGTAKVNNIIGQARTAASADGDIIEIVIQPFVVKTAAS